MKVTALLENTTKNDSMLTEHGLSLYIETNEHKILFDMGQTDLFLKNAKVLGIDIADVDIAILSHGHYDHGGGLAKFLEINKKAPVYISSHAFEPHYNGKEKYIGLDTSIKDNSRLIYVENEKIIDTSLELYSCNERERPNDLGSFGLTKRMGDELLPDDFSHEQYLLIKESNKRILISGCSHKGIVDIVSWLTPGILIGGFHLSKMMPCPELDKIGDMLEESKALYYTCHCTGTEQYEYMKKRMSRLYYLSCGDMIEI